MIIRHIIRTIKYAHTIMDIIDYRETRFFADFSILLLI